MAEIIKETISTNDLAYNRNIGGIQPFQLWAGKGQIKTQVFDSKGLVFGKYEVVALDADGKTIIKYDPTAAAVEGVPAPASRPYGFTCQPTTAADKTVSVFYAGTPNHAALVWPASLTTYPDRRAAFLNGHPKNEITIERLMGL